MPELPPDAAVFEELLADLRGGRVSIKVPQRGDKKTLQETVARNAGQALVLHKTRRASDLTTRNRALEEIQTALELPEVPLRIECYDISNLQGTEVVASMVVFEDGLPRKGEYRRFVIRGEGDTDERQVGQNDVAHMHQVITRRFRRLLDEQARSEPRAPGSPDGTDGPDGPMLVDPETGRPRKFAYAPGLVVVDGGAPAGRGRAARARRARHRRHPGLRAGQAPRGGLAAAARRTRSSWPAPPRASTCSSGSATRRTASRSPTTAAAGRRPWWRACSTTCPASARCVAGPCSSTSAR